MSVIEDESITPWVGNTCYKNYFSIVVISSNLQIVGNIADALEQVHARGDHSWKLQTIRCTNLQEIVRESNVTGNVSVDFVVIALDTRKVFCVEWAKMMLLQVHPDLMQRRVVLVNAAGLGANEMAVDTDDILTLQDNMNLDLLNANVHKPEDAAFLARRLLTYLEVFVGVKTGIPNLNM